MTLRLVFMGTPDFSVPVLEAVLAAGHEVVAVYSQPPRPAGRGMEDTASPVHRAALAHGIPVHTPVDFKAEGTRAAFTALNADAAVVVAYGLILPEAILKGPRLGCFNVHASRLPRWRGAAPIQRAIMAGDTVSGVMVMRMEKGLDTGPICFGRDVAIPPDMTAGELHDALSKAGAEAMVEALSKLKSGHLTSTPQCTEGVTYAAKIEKSETHIDFSKSAASVVNHIRGLSPAPGAWFAVSTGGKIERIKVLKAVAVAGFGLPGTMLDGGLTVACGDGAIRLVEVQRAGKKPQPAQEFARGFKFVPGTRVS